MRVKADPGNLLPHGAPGVPELAGFHRGLALTWRPSTSRDCPRWRT